MRLARGVECRYLHREEAMLMLLEQVCLLFIYILFTELAIVTIVAIALLIVLIIMSKKIDNKKNTSLLDR